MTAVRVRPTLHTMDGALTGGTYEIVIGSVLAEDWSAWLTDVDVVEAGSTTVLRGTVADQAALHGLLAHLRDLGVPLLAMRRIDPATAHGIQRGDPGHARPSSGDVR